MIQSIDFVAGLECKKCGKFFPFSNNSGFIKHKDGSCSIKTKDFHSVICDCENEVRK